MILKYALSGCLAAAMSFGSGALIAQERGAGDGSGGNQQQGQSQGAQEGSPNSPAEGRQLPPARANEGLTDPPSPSERKMEPRERIAPKVQDPRPEERQRGGEERPDRPRLNAGELPDSVRRTPPDVRDQANDVRRQGERRAENAARGASGRLERYLRERQDRLEGGDQDARNREAAERITDRIDRPNNNRSDNNRPGADQNRREVNIRTNISDVRNIDQISRQVRNQIQQANRRNLPTFDINFYGENQQTRMPRYAHLNRNNPRDAGFWWRATPYTSLQGWIDVNLGDPVLYTYGPQGNVTFRDGYVYRNDQRLVPVQEYYQQARALIRAVPEQDLELEWRPLGVFAVVAEENEEPHLFVQLAINQRGSISGTLHNEESETTRPLQGSVAESSQRLAFGFADGSHSDFVVESTLYNLTQPESTALVHFGELESETWVLVRLER